MAELGGYEPTAPKLEVSAGFKFADIVFDNIFTDLAVGRQIRDAQDNAGQPARQVRALRDRFKAQADTITWRLAEMDAERRQLLMRS